jgi:hypothetical protein
VAKAVFSAIRGSEVAMSGWSGVSLARAKGGVLGLASDWLWCGDLRQILRYAGYQVKVASNLLADVELRQ